jgi:hypothetical protein
VKLALALVGAACAAMVAVVFAKSWRGGDVWAAVVLGAAFLSLVLVAIVALQVSS